MTIGANVADLVLELIDLEEKRQRSARMNPHKTQRQIAAEAHCRLLIKRDIRRELVKLCGNDKAQKLIEKLNHLMENGL